MADRDRPRKHAARARPVPALGRPAPAVWRWQRRCAEEGVDGLLRDRTRKPGKAPPGDGLARRVVALTCAEPPLGPLGACARAC